MSATLPAMMTSKQFSKATTPNSIFKRGRGSLVEIDLILKLADKTTAFSPTYQIKITAGLCREIRDWLTRKANKSTSNADMRRPVVRQLGDQAFARLQYLTFELRKLKGAKGDLKGLSAGYTHERTTYEASGKTKAIAGSTASALVKNAGAIGTNVDKPFSQLTQKEFEDLVMTYAEKQMMPTEVKFMAKQERIGRLVYVQDGIFWESAAERFDTVTKATDEFPYAMDQYGNLFSTDHHEAEAAMSMDERFNHSSFNAGKDVICAGMIGIVQGKLRYIDNNSGHYKAGRRHLRNALDVLRGQGVILTDVKAGAKEIANDGKEVFRYWHDAHAWLMDSGRQPDESIS